VEAKAILFALMLLIRLLWVVLALLVVIGVVGYFDNR
jgi:hypothetical protein